MTEHDRMGSHRDQDDEGGITLPSWVDAAIAKARSDADEDRPYTEEAGDSTVPTDPQADTREDADRESTPKTTRSEAPFPSFLERRPAARPPLEPMEARTAPGTGGPIPQHDSPLAFAQDPVEDGQEDYDEFDQQRARIVTEALAEVSSSPPPSEPIPLPVAPSRRRGAAGPWLIAALFFAAAALVLAVLMWVRPLPR